jgi:hypothetical protein
VKTFLQSEHKTRDYLFKLPGLLLEWVCNDLLNGVGGLSAQRKNAAMNFNFEWLLSTTTLLFFRLSVQTQTLSVNHAEEEVEVDLLLDLAQSFVLERSLSV